MMKDFKAGKLDGII